MLNHLRKLIFAPLLTISYDIECDSSHGDFPLASKNYKKLAAELLDNINARFKRVIQDKDLTRQLSTDKEMQTQILVKMITLSFLDKPNKEEISFCYTKDRKKPKKQDILDCAKKIKDILFIRLKKKKIIRNYEKQLIKPRNSGVTNP